MGRRERHFGWLMSLRADGGGKGKRENLLGWRFWFIKLAGIINTRAFSEVGENRVVGGGVTAGAVGRYGVI